jgi:hypothetical protein
MTLIATATPGSVNDEGLLFTAGKSGHEGMLGIMIAVESNAIFEFTRNNGTKWHKVNRGNAILANDARLFYVYIKSGDVFNIRNKTGSAVTVTQCDLFQDDAEARLG